MTRIDENALTAEQAAAAIGCSVSTLYRLARARRLRRRRLYGRVVFEAADVMRVARERLHPSH